MNVATLAIENIQCFGEYPSVYHEGEWTTNVFRLRQAEKLASILRDQGVKPGDRVLVMMANDPAVMDAFQAVWRLGAVIIPVTPQWVANEVNYVLHNSSAQVAITSSALIKTMIEATKDVAGFRRILVHGPTAIDGTLALEPMMQSATPIEFVCESNDNDLAMLIYTSGTTGKPKGVMQSHLSLIKNVRAAAALGNPAPFTMTMHVLPLSHVFGVLCMNLGAILGYRSIILSQWDTRKVFETIDQFKVSRFSVVPTMLSYLLNFADRHRYDCSSLDVVSAGGAATPDEVRREFERVFQCRLKDGYGCSEATCAISSYHDSQSHRVGSVGLPLHEMELAILNDTDESIPAELEGEICVRGPHVMQGYWQDPVTTESAMRNGWLHTGDLGKVDRDGYVYITGRKKDLIIKGGENISPREIEEAIYQHPAIAEAAVIGVPDETFGEQVCAVVVLRPGMNATGEDLMKHVSGYVNRFKLPSTFLFRNELPKSPVGKILKRALREEYADIELKPSVKK